MLHAHPLPDAPLDADIAILGKKGRGKTFTAKGFVERLLHIQRRVLVLDPLSVWWGLKSGAAGKSPGFPIVGEVDRIAWRGRNFGFRQISITQRPAKLRKDVLAQPSTLVVLGVTSPQDRDAV